MLSSPVAVQPPVSRHSGFVPVPETHLPCGLIVPAFEVSQFLCTKSIGTDLLGDANQMVGDRHSPESPNTPATQAHARAQSVADRPPWTWITYYQACRACEASGWSLIRESQWLAIAHLIARHPENWTGGAVGAGKLRQGLHNTGFDYPPAGLLVPHSDKENRWKTLSSHHRLCDFGGNAWSWIYDDLQGEPNGTARIVEPDSPSLTTAPYPPREKGMGIRPTDRRAWDGRALIRGGSWRGGKDTGAFALYAARAHLGYRSVGFRATRPITGESA